MIQNANNAIVLVRLNDSADFRCAIGTVGFISNIPPI